MASVSVCDRTSIERCTTERQMRRLKEVAAMGLPENNDCLEALTQCTALVDAQTLLRYRTPVACKCWS